MQLLLFGAGIAVVALLGMVLLAPRLERKSWEKRFTCPPPKPETPRHPPQDPAPHRNSLHQRIRTFVFKTYSSLRAASP